MNSYNKQSRTCTCINSYTITDLLSGIPGD